MFRSPAAIHEQVTRLYRHFGVTSRGELAAYFIRRQPVDEPAPPAFDLLAHWLDRRAPHQQPTTGLVASP